MSSASSCLYQTQKNISWKLNTHVECDIGSVLHKEGSPPCNVNTPPSPAAAMLDFFLSDFNISDPSFTTAAAAAIGPTASVNYMYKQRQHTATVSKY